MKKLTAVNVADVSYAYGKTTVLEQVSFQIEEGEFVGIFGPNGGGKTTLLRLLMGFNNPIKGTIRLFDKEPQKLRPQIGYVPQISRLDKDFPITVLETVLMAFTSEIPWHGIMPSWCKKAAIEALAKVGLEDKLHSPFGLLSGGQAQRVLIARAIAANPKILFLDEPTASVDPEAEHQILQILSKLKGHITILMVTHDLQTILHKVEKLLCVHRTAHILSSDEVCQHFGLGLYHSPFTSIQNRAH